MAPTAVEWLLLIDLPLPAPPLLSAPWAPRSPVISGITREDTFSFIGGDTYEGTFKDFGYGDKGGYVNYTTNTTRWVRILGGIEQAPVTPDHMQICSRSLTYQMSV